MVLAYDIFGNELFSGDLVYVNTLGLVVIKHKTKAGNLVFDNGSFVPYTRSKRFVKINEDKVHLYIKQLKEQGKNDYIVTQLDAWIRDRKQS